MNNLFYISWIFDDATKAISTFFFHVLLLIDSFVYQLVDWIYQIIINICNVNLFGSTNVIDNLVDRIYVIIGVAMLFVLAYTLLKSMINPDEALKGKQSPTKLITNVIISVVLIAIIPSIFEIAMGFQNALLTENTIGKIIIGTDGSKNPQTAIDEGGFNMAFGVFQAFFHPSSQYCQYTIKDDDSDSSCTELNVDYNGSQMTYSAYWDLIKTNKDILMIQNFAPLAQSGDIEYMFLISTLAGAFVVLVLISYCVDLALRTVKLGVYQLISPIPILARLVPGDQGSKVFSNWLKATISTYVEVFIRLAILFFAIITIDAVMGSWTKIFTESFEGASPILGFVTLAFIIIGVIMFVKQAPGIIKEITGLDGNKYNVLKSAKQAFSAMAGGIVGLSPLAAARAYEMAGKTDKLTDFSAIGNQYIRRKNAQEARRRQQNAGLGPIKRTGSRAKNALAQAFGFSTDLERVDRYLDKGYDMEGNYRRIENDTGRDLDVRDDKGRVIDRIGVGHDIVMDEKTVTALLHQKEQNKLKLSAKDEEIRHIKSAKGDNEMFINLRSQIKKEAEDKSHEGDSDIKSKLYIGTKLVAEGNYKTLEDYVQTRINAGASADELNELNEQLKKANDEIWVAYANREIATGNSTKIGALFEQAKNYYNAAGGYFDKTTNKNEKVDEVSLNMNNMEFFEGGYEKDKHGNYKLDSSGNKIKVQGIDKKAKSNNSLLDTKIASIENDKAQAQNENFQIDRIMAHAEDLKSDDRSSQKYQAYKATDEARKLNSGGKK